MNQGRSKAELPTHAARGVSVAVIVSQFNADITHQLLEGALECLTHYGNRPNEHQVFFCPGAFELPQVANRLCATHRWNAIICLGAVIRGETPHFDYVCSEAARGIQEVALKSRTPVIFGVLTTNTVKQARERAGGKHGNKGWDAAVAAIAMASLFTELPRTGKSYVR